MRAALNRRKKMRKAKAFYSSLLKPGDLVFDIGANTGRRSAIYLQLGAKVIAVEPQTSCLRSLQQLQKKYPHFTIEQKAVGSESGTKQLYVSNESEVSTFSTEFIHQYEHQRFLKWDKREVVECITINELIDKYGVPAYCKIDVENYEFEVISVLRHVIPLISFEFNYPLRHTAIKCMEYLSELCPYTFNFTAFEDMQFANSEFLPAAEFKKQLQNLDPSILTGEVYAQYTLK